MADYNNLQAAITAGETNMTVLRNNVKNDDNTVAYDTDVNWFKYDGVTVDKIYSSGNSWIGFGKSSEQLRVNRRDGAVWYEYKETGSINGIKFFKFRWKGTSHYSQSYTTESSQSNFDVFLFENGIIYLNWYKVPTSYFSGTNSLSDSDETHSFSPSSGEPYECYWTSSDEDHSIWSDAVEGKPEITPPIPPAPDPDIVYDFVDGRYRVKLRSTYMVLGSNREKHKDSNPFEFISKKIAPPGEMYTFISRSNRSVDTDNYYPYVDNNIDTEVSEEGTINGLNYKIYGNSKICIITGTQTSGETPSGGYPWKPDYPEVYTDLVFYIDANLICMDNLFQQNGSGATQREIVFGKNCTFANPISCINAFGEGGGVNVYQSYLLCINNISNNKIHVSNAKGMFSGISLDFRRPENQDTDYDAANWNFWINTLDFSSCTSFEEMFAENRSALLEADFSMHDLSNVTNIYQMFRNSNVAYIDFGSTFDESNVTTMNYFIGGEMNHPKITEFELHSKLTNGADAIFGCRLGSGCDDLEEVDLSAPEPVIVASHSYTTWEYAFYSCSKLRYINLENQIVTEDYNDSYKGYIFSGCNNLEILVCPFQTWGSNYDRIKIPKTMYDCDGRSYSYLADGNKILVSDRDSAPDWFDFTRTVPYSIVDDDGNSIDIGPDTHVDEVIDETYLFKKYKVFGNSIIVANNSNIEYPSELSNKPKWVINDNYYGRIPGG